jgi:hypothetical protein
LDVVVFLDGFVLALEAAGVKLQLLDRDEGLLYLLLEVKYAESCGWDELTLCWPPTCPSRH